MLIHPLSSKIDLSNKNLKEIPEEVFRCKNLKKLNLSNNKIKVIPKELSQLRRLKNLDISNNQIAGLYSKNFEFRDLEVLILNNNCIKNLPKQISGLGKLKKLSLSGNLISELPSELSRLFSLQVLNLANNQLRDFPEVILDLSNLNTLWLNNNYFRNFPASEFREKLPNLKSLYCFGKINSPGITIDDGYATLQKAKGNCLNQLNLLTLKGKSKIKFETVMHDELNNGILPKRRSLFISYCHADEAWLKMLKVTLQTMEYEGVELDTWDDTKIDAGDMWKDEIEKALERADIAILLVSNAFLASRFIREKEVPVLLKSAEERGVKILPVIVGLCRFTKSAIGHYQAVNKPEKPLNSLSIHEQEKVFYDITLEIDKVLSK
ncbi:leucine-rich repeat domain-containing protein [Arcticibacter sp. MXS-1]|uniref:leucine-rich repeat domain-containing protein n=1 Tax=Arcticibacter sp. MXS-1 TaxID=3341726 RepID=UPI0035A8CE77